MLVLESFLPGLADADFALAKTKQMGWLPNRKSGGLALMRIGCVPIPNRYKFLFFTKHYSRPFRTDEMKKRDQTPPGEVAKASVADPQFEKRFPRVWEYLTLLHFDDGSARELSKLSIFVENGKFKVALNDAAEKASLYVSGDTVDGVLKALESTLGHDNPEWRAWNQNTKKK